MFLEDEIMCKGAVSSNFQLKLASSSSTYTDLLCIFKTEHEHFSLSLEYIALKFDLSKPSFRINVPYPSSWLGSKPTKKLARSMQQVSLLSSPADGGDIFLRNVG